MRLNLLRLYLLVGLTAGCNLFGSLEEVEGVDARTTDSGVSRSDTGDPGGALDAGNGNDTRFPSTDAADMSTLASDSGATDARSNTDMAVPLDLGPLPDVTSTTDASNTFDAEAPVDVASPVDTGPPDMGPPCLFNVSPLGYWSFDRVVGGVSYPTTGTAQDLQQGTIIGIVNSSPGVGRAAADFRSAAGFVNIDSSSSMARQRGSLAFWFINGAVPLPGERVGIVTRDADGNEPGHMAAFLLENGSLQVRFQTGLSSWYLDSSAAISLDVWHHVTINFGALGLELFIDGVLHDSEFAPLSLAGNSESMFVGASSANRPPGTAMADGYLDGSVDELYLFDRPLTAAEIADLMSVPCR